MNRYLDTEKANMEIPLHNDKVKDWFFPSDNCMSDFENSFEISDNTILYEKYTEETKISITINNSKVTKYFSKIISTIERLLDAIAYNIISSDDEEQVARMQEFIKRFHKFYKGE